MHCPWYRMRGTMPFGVAPSDGGLSVLAWLATASELDRGQAERDPDQRTCSQAPATRNASSVQWNDCDT